MRYFKIREKIKCNSSCMKLTEIKEYFPVILESHQQSKKFLIVNNKTLYMHYTFPVNERNLKTH